jgi:hypothetical protein
LGISQQIGEGDISMKTTALREGAIYQNKKGMRRRIITLLGNGDVVYTKFHKDGSENTMRVDECFSTTFADWAVSEVTE